MGPKRYVTYTYAVAVFVSILEDHSNARSMHSLVGKLAEGSYSNVLELTKITTAYQVICQDKFMQTFGCAFYNFNKELSACHFADLLEGSITDKPGDLANWNIYRLEKFSIEDKDEF